MYLLYIDESGDVGIRGSSYFVLGAVALFEGAWYKAKSRIETLLRGYFPHRPILPELHAKDILHGSKAYRKLPKQKRFQLLGDACRLINRMGRTELIAFTIIIEKQWWFNNRPANPIYEYGFEELVNRFDLFLARRHATDASTKGMIILDENKTSLVTAIKQALANFQNTGTRWATIHNVIENALFFPSHVSPGVQLADICSYAVLRLIEKNDCRWISLIQNKFDQEPVSSPVNPGKWHGVKFFGSNTAKVNQLNSLWFPRP